MILRKILVTGGAGFIGSNLCSKLIDQGHEVICLDNFFTGNKKNIFNLLNNPRFELVRHDITIPYHAEVDQIYNLACPASPVHYQYNPVKTINTSILGAINMLNLAKEVNATILQASTSEVYGDPLIHPQVESYWGNVNPVGVRSCYTDDTEILTNTGWKYFTHLNSTDEIATLNPITKKLEYYQPYEIIKEQYEGDIYTFKNWNIDLSVTPNHNMYVKYRQNEEFVFQKAEYLHDFRHVNLLKTCEWDGIGQEYFYFPEYTKNLKYCKIPIMDKVRMDDWLEFMGYFLTEGCTYLQKAIKIVNNKTYHTKKYRIQISQSKLKNPIVFEKIKNCLARLNIKYSISKSGNSYFVFQNKQLFTYLSTFGKSKDKFIPREFLNLSKRQLNILYEAMMDGDASKITTTQSSHIYYSISDKLLDGVQELLLKIGRYGNIQNTPTGRKTKSMTCINNEKSHQYSKPTIKKYEGYVYCVNVKNHIIYVRRNGKAVFCGNCYDEGKRCAETLFVDYHRQYNTKIKIIRIFNTYGINMQKNDGRVVSNFIIQALKNENITIYGNGSQTRSFQYIDDLIEGMIRMMNTPESFIGPVNIGNPNEINIKKLAEKIIQLTNSDSKIINLPLPSDDPIKRKPDISLAYRELDNWTPKITLEEGLIKTINYFKNII
jgi:UDP-glucuronate decarboxylase